MIFRIQSKAPVVFETIAFADIVINLFIFFFVTFGLFAAFDISKRGTLPIELPKADHAQTRKQPNPITITIDQKGSIYLGSQMISFFKLQESINRELSLRKEKNVIVHADRTIPLQKFVSVLDVIQNTKARTVSIETEI